MSLGSGTGLTVHRVIHSGLEYQDQGLVVRSDIGFRRFVRGAGYERGTDVRYDATSKRRNQREGAT
jgi:hypothetical protein